MDRTVNKIIYSRRVQMGLLSCLVLYRTGPWYARI